jgi:hypothetical protein
MVIDADGLGVVEKHLKGSTANIFEGYSRAVLTPNVPEFWSLCDCCHVEHNGVQPQDDPTLVQVPLVSDANLSSYLPTPAHTAPSLSDCLPAPALQASVIPHMQCKCTIATSTSTCSTKHAPAASIRALGWNIHACRQQPPVRSMAA